MIPVRVALSNFLTYSTSADGGPLTFDFDGAKLWSISGDNGAGKTTVFDAIRYALFGEHRGGRQHDGRLVRKGATDMEVAFEFSHGEQMWRIRRTLNLYQRSNGTTLEHKAAEVATWDDSHRVWIPIPGADTPRGVDAWVNTTLQLSSEVFKSTVLLEQGGADRLLTVPPAARFNILSGLIDLAIYRRLEEAAGSRRRREQATAKAIASQLDDTPDISDEDLARARTDAGDADDTLTAANNRASEATMALAGARRFVELRLQADKLEEKLRHLEELLADADPIRANAARAVELGSIIPTLEEASHFLREGAAADNERAEAKEQIDEIELTVLAAELDDAGRGVETADADVATLEATDEEFRAWQPQLKTRHNARAAVARQREALSEAGDPSKIAAEIRTMIEHRDATLVTLTDLETREDLLRHEAASHDAQAAQVASVIAERLGAAHEAACSRCGQPVDRDHLELELEELDRTRSEARDQATEVTERHDAVKQQIIAARDLERDLIRKIDAGQNRAKVAAKATDDLAAALRDLSDILTVVLPASWAKADGDDESARTAAATLDDRARRLPDELRAARQAATGARKAYDTAQSCLHETEIRATRLDGDLKRHTERARVARAAAASRLNSLDENLRAEFADRSDDLVADLNAEADSLAGASDRLAALTQAEHERDAALAGAKTTAQDMEAVPPEHRLTIEDAEAALGQARTAVATVTKTRDQARDNLRILEENLQRREKLLDRQTEAARNAMLADRLERLLGRTGLQGALLKRAIDGVADLANETLTRLSSGTLAVSLRLDNVSGSGKLEIHVTDATSADEPLEAAFISGSQKFRVAVALAAGLGQYVGGPEAIRSLIIDEGFGSLDETGRDEMIAELHNLANHLERVIVVSHHTDFSDPARFPHSFHLRKVGQHTEVTRVI